MASLSMYVTLHEYVCVSRYVCYSAPAESERKVYGSGDNGKWGRDPGYRLCDSRLFV